VKPINSAKFSFQFKKVKNNKESKSVLYGFKKSIDILEKNQFWHFWKLLFFARK
jgi:hypothetical protein